MSTILQTLSRFFGIQIKKADLEPVPPPKPTPRHQKRESSGSLQKNVSSSKVKAVATTQKTQSAAAGYKTRPAGKPDGTRPAGKPAPRETNESVQRSEPMASSPAWNPATDPQMMLLMMGEDGSRSNSHSNRSHRQEDPVSRRDDTSHSRHNDHGTSHVRHEDTTSHFRGGWSSTDTSSSSSSSSSYDSSPSFSSD